MVRRAVVVATPIQKIMSGPHAADACSLPEGLTLGDLSQQDRRSYPTRDSPKSIRAFDEVLRRGETVLLQGPAVRSPFPTDVQPTTRRARGLQPVVVPPEDQVENHIGP